MRTILAVLLMIATALWPAAAAYAKPAPAAYVVGLSLGAGDPTPVKRGGQIAAKLLMPLYKGDQIELKDPASRMRIELSDGRSPEIKGGDKPYVVDTDARTGDDAASVIATIGTVMGGDESTSAENMAAREGAAIVIDIAKHGTNLLSSRRSSIWLTWSGGTGPFTITVKGPNGDVTLPPVTERFAQVPVNLSGGARVTIEISDAAAGRAKLDVRGADAPKPPASLNTGRATPLAPVILATWLLRQQKGAWRLEAAQLLHVRPSEDGLSAKLLAQLEQGWSP